MQTIRMQKEVPVIASYHTVVCGGGAAGWRTVALIYAVIGLIVNTISVFSVKELPEADDEMDAERKEEHQLTFLQSLSLLLKNKYYIIICI